MRSADDGITPDAADDVGRTASILAQWRRARPDLDLSGFLIGVQIGRLGLLSQQIAGRTAGLFEIGPGEMLVVTALRRQGPPYALRPTDLFRLLGVTSGAMTYRIDKLVARGLVERAPDPEDGRGAVIRLTSAGIASADKVVDVAAEFWNARLANLAVEPGAMARLEASLAELADQMERFER